MTDDIIVGFDVRYVEATSDFLLKCSQHDWAQIYPAELPTSLEKGFDPLKGTSLHVPSLQAMARLWLLLPEIRDALSDSTVYDDIRTKLTDEALEGR